MKTFYNFILIVFTTSSVFAQIGINTTDPKAQLEIKSSNEAIPTITDGLLIPKVNVFPVTNPTIDQQGMLVYLKNVSGTDQPGFYYWNFSTLDWIPILTGIAGGTLDQAYDFGGAGLGKTITADAGAVLINGTDGLISTGTLNSGAIAPSGAGTRMFWNPRKGAFRAGRVSTTQWDDANIGLFSTAFGDNVVALGTSSTAFGSSNTASGTFSTVFGNNNVSNGSFSTVFGSNNTASGSFSTVFGSNNNASATFSTVLGQFNIASGTNAIAIGFQNTARSFGETVFGIGATDYTTSTNGATQFRIGNATDRLFVVGNAIDLNSNGVVDTSEKKDALVILKNGATGLGNSLPEGILDVKSSNNGILIPRVSLTSALVQAPVLNPQTGSLETSTLIYNTATNGVAPNNVYPGFYYWNGAKWTRFDVDGENNSKYYTVVGTSQDFTTTTLTALDQMTINFTPKDDTILVNFSAAGFRFDDGFQENVIFFQLTLNGIPVTGWQTASKQSIVDTSLFTDDITIWESNISYPITVPIGIPQTVAIQWSCPNATMNNSPSINHTAFGQVYKSYRSLTVIDPNGGGGIIGSPPVTTNLWALNGNTATNSLVNFVGTADNQPLVLKSNNVEGLRIATNSNVGLGTTNPLDKLHVVGNIRMVDGNQAAGKVLTSDINGTATWQSLVSNDWSLSGNAGTNAGTNFIGTTDDVDVVFRRFNTRAGFLGTTNTSFGLSALNPISTGVNNTALGFSSLEDNTTGISNTSIGYNALPNNTTGSDNTVIGVAAMVTTTTGNLNTAIGRSALFDNTIGSSNTATGSSALSNNTTGTHNTAVGANALITVNAGTFNTAIGAEANVSSTILTNATAIGSRALAGNNNVLILGSVNGVNGATSSVNVGIGTTSPQTRLEVVDENVVTTVTTEGNLNVVTNNPQAIDVGASISLGGTTTDAGTFLRTFATVEGRKSNSTTSNSAGYLIFKTSNTTLTEKMRITNLGDVGIGTPIPGGQFELSLNEGRKPISNTWTIPSDARLKTVNGNYEKGLNEIIQLQPIKYNYKNTDKRTFEDVVLNQQAYGFLAQQVQPLFPEAVGVDGDGYLNFDLHPILIASINAFKELNQKNEVLQLENKVLKQQLEAQSKIINEILNRVELLETKN